MLYSMIAVILWFKCLVAYSVYIPIEKEIVVTVYVDRPLLLEDREYSCKDPYRIPKDTTAKYLKCMKEQASVKPNLGAAQCTCMNQMDTPHQQCAVFSAIQREWLCADLQPYCDKKKPKVPPEYLLEEIDASMESYDFGYTDNLPNVPPHIVTKEAKATYTALLASYRLHALAHNEYCRYICANKYILTYYIHYI
eukprot:GHVR01095731.1.p1 GENE.GHVR01095731.1~~GHVR01095731.1.p1  ORF type:complete len:195 (+),score=30.43 GHVR01095731.1:37-621(+)